MLTPEQFSQALITLKNTELRYGSDAETNRDIIITDTYGDGCDAAINLRDDDYVTDEVCSLADDIAEYLMAWKLEQTEA